MAMGSVGFLSDVEEIIAKTESPLGVKAEASRKLQASTLPEKVRLMRSGTFCSDLVSHNSKEVLKGVGGFLKAVTTGEMAWPSLSAFVFFGVTKFGISLETAEARIALTSATLGEIPNDMLFHNNARYRKVLISTIRQISIHNNLYHDTEWELDPRDISMMMAAANIQDFMYTTVVNGGHSLQFKEKSFEAAKPFLREAGADEGFLEDLETVVLSTRVNTLDQSDESFLQVKSAYRHYFNGRGDKPELGYDFARLQDNPKLCLIAALCHEAALMPSLAFGHWQAKAELMALGEEADFSPSPEMQIDFMMGFADGFITKAGQVNRNGFITTLEAFKNERAEGVSYCSEEDKEVVPLKAAHRPLENSFPS